ncbi:MAG TPA: M4 family metallopeptidase [Tepidisphaeraceae bacterium]|nr:M4 family metallopeptidase [Tepidisphaeraceae bacterium]
MLVSLNDNISASSRDENGKTESKSNDRITVIVDRDLYRFLKVSAAVLAILLGITAFGVGLDFRAGTSSVAQTMKEMRAETDEVKKIVEGIKQSAEEVNKNRAAIDDLKTHAGEADKRFQDTEREIDSRIVELLKRQPQGLSEQQVREMIVVTLADAFSKSKNLGDGQDPDRVVAAVRATTQPGTDAEARARKAIEADIAYATEFLNKKFTLQFVPPPLILLSASDLNAYWNGSSVHAPPQVQYLHDVTFREVSHRYIEDTVKLNFEGEPGALESSYANILAIWIRQSKPDIALKEYWLFAPGALAWLEGKDPARDQTKMPLENLRNPGQAYRNDAVLGNDPQVGHMKDIYRGFSDNGGVHINAGIPNRAFCELAQQLNFNRAEEIWLLTFQKLLPTSKFIDVANTMLEVCKDTKEQRAIHQAWSAVGVFSEPAIGFQQVQQRNPSPIQQALPPDAPSRRD